MRQGGHLFSFLVYYKRGHVARVKYLTKWQKRDHKNVLWGDKEGHVYLADDTRLVY